MIAHWLCGLWIMVCEKNLALLMVAGKENLLNCVHKSAIWRVCAATSTISLKRSIKPVSEKSSWWEVPLWRKDSFSFKQRSMQHKSLKQRHVTLVHSLSSLYFQRGPGSQPKQILYRVSQFPAVPLSCYFWIQSQTALFLAGKMNKHNSVQADVNETLVYNADGSVFLKYKQN